MSARINIAPFPDETAIDWRALVNAYALPIITLLLVTVVVIWALQTTGGEDV